MATTFCVEARGNHALNRHEGNDFLLGDAGFDILSGGGVTDNFII